MEDCVTRPTRWLVVAAPIIAAAAGACSGDDLASPPSPPPPPAETARIDSVSAAPNPTNVLAASVAVLAEHADSARVLFAAPGGPPDSTPSIALADGRAAVPVLGLRSGVGYHGVVEVSGRGGRVQSDSVSFAGGELPEPLRHISFATTGTGSRGLTLTALALGGSTLFALAFDSSGTIRWYRGFAFDGPQATGDLKQQVNGHFTLFVGATTGSQPVPGHYVEFGPAGDSLRALTAPAPLYTDNHELVITGTGLDERFHLFGYDRRRSDLSPIGGPAAAQLTGHSLLRLTSDGTAEFAWSAWDHLRIQDWIEPPRPDPVNPDQPDFDHPNALALDLDGNYIVSWRNLGEVTKIDARSGEVLWRLGGANNQFTFVDDPLGGFSAQHYARILPDGHLLLYDNGTRHKPQETRVVEYALDVAARTATLVWEFRHVPPIYTSYVGSVQRLASGNTAIGYGFAGHATEVAPDGGPVWEADLRVDGEPVIVYRMVRIGSLYGYEAP
jgi:hypothetical protein